MVKDSRIQDLRTKIVSSMTYEQYRAAPPQSWRGYSEEEVARAILAIRGAGNLLEILVWRYGSREGRRVYDKRRLYRSYSQTLPGYVEKYGEEDGARLYAEKNSRLSVGRESLARRGFSEQEIEDTRRRHREGSANTAENFAKRRGVSLAEGRRMQEDHERHCGLNSPRRVEHWIRKGYTRDEARALVSELQRCTLDTYLKRYGDVLSESEIRRMYIDMCMKKTATWFKNCGDASSKIEKTASKLVRSVLRGIKDRPRVCIHDHVAGQKTLAVQGSLVRPDVLLLFPEIGLRLVIEINGDYWHGNPRKHTGVNHRGKAFKDLKRKTYLRSKALRTDGYRVLNIWEEWVRDDIDRVRRRITRFIERNLIKQEIKNEARQAA